MEAKTKSINLEGLAMNSIRFVFEDRLAEAYDFVLADDLYLFFKFGSPNSRCEIAIAYDEYMDGGDWYVNEGHLDRNDLKLVNDIVWEYLYTDETWQRLCCGIDKLIAEFNGKEGE